MVSLSQLLRENIEALKDWPHWLHYALGKPRKNTHITTIKCFANGRGMAFQKSDEDRSDGNKVCLVISDKLVLTAHRSRPQLPWKRLYQLLTFDIQRRAPFLLDRCTVLAPDPQQDGTSAFWLIRNSLLAELRNEADRQRWYVESLQVGDVHGFPVHPQQVRTLFRNETAGSAKASNLVLITCLIVAILAGPLIVGTRLDIAEDDVISKIEAILPLATKAKADISQLRSKREAGERLASSLRQSFSTIALLDELSDVLPSDTWLTDMALTDTTIAISGFSPNAASLIGRFDRSKQFRNAAFTSPVERSVENKLDHFSITAKVASHD